VSLATLALAGGCGAGGAPTSDHVQEPVVRSFSPFMSPFDFNTLQQNPTFTDAGLTISTDPTQDPPGSLNYLYRGKIVIYFQAETEIDPASVFIGGVPFLGPDPSALAVTQEIPGVGNVPIPVQVTLETHPSSGAKLLVCQPLPPYSAPDGLGGYITNLPDGQYTVALTKNIKNTEGRALRDGPVFHSFSVGASDTILPRVVSTQPGNGASNVGAGAPAPAPPPGVPAESVAGVNTSIFGDTTPDLFCRFSEPVKAPSINENTIQVVDAGAFIPGGGAPPPLAPAPGFPKLKTENDQATLPSNGHEAIWRADLTQGGFPFGTQVQVTVLGLWNDAASMAANPGTPDNPSPVEDLTGNYMELSYTFQFQTIAPPDLPQNPFPEFAIWWSGQDRVGCIDTVNQPGLADQFFGLPVPPLGVPKNVLPAFTDTIATDEHIPNFNPLEINIDTRTNGGSCHSWAYVQSANSGQVVIVNTRNSVPVALINSPKPGGIAVQGHYTGPGVLLVTNESANTFTAYSIGALTPGLPFLNGPLYINKVQPTGNTPRAISITQGPPPAVAPDHWNRDGANTGPSTEVIMYADFTDGNVSTTTLASDGPVRQFALGPNSSPNDISFTPCFGIPAIMFAAISQGGLPGEGKVAYYVAGPGCQTGFQVANRPDAIVGDLTGFDGPDGLDNNFLSGTQVFFTIAESGQGANAVTTLGLEIGAANLPRIITKHVNVGDNPVKVAHRPSWLNPCIGPAFDGNNDCGHDQTATCHYNGTEQDVLLNFLIDGTMVPTKALYICARGASQVTVIDLISGQRAFYSPIGIPSVRFVASTCTQ